jgi:hypothetical protein
MSVLNNTPFPAIAFRQYNLAGEMNGVVAVRGTFKMVPDGPLLLVEEQAPLEMIDFYDGEPLSNDLLRPGDLAPFRPGTDVTFTGAAYAPGGAPAQSWTCGISVGPVSKDLRVHGERSWIAEIEEKAKGFTARRVERRRVGWRMGPAEPAQYVILTWKNAYGGEIPHWGKDTPDVDPANPVGCGILNDHIPLAQEKVRAPQIEAIHEPVTKWQEQYAPQNLAPIAPFWRARQKYAGTYDDVWLNTRHPLLPRDFDFHFWQSAHPDLIAKRWLNGDEPFELRNLIYRHPIVRGFLPGISLGMRLETQNGVGIAELVLDGVHFDMRPGQGNVFLTWRAGFPWPDGEGQPELTAYEIPAEVS